MLVAKAVRKAQDAGASSKNVVKHASVSNGSIRRQSVQTTGRESNSLALVDMDMDNGDQ